MNYKLDSMGATIINILQSTINSLIHMDFTTLKFIMMIVYYIVLGLFIVGVYVGYRLLKCKDNNERIIYRADILLTWLYGIGTIVLGIGAISSLLYYVF